jgi:twin BRCT domain
VHHPNRPVAVSAEWLLESWQSQALKQPHDFPPIKGQQSSSIKSAATMDGKEHFIKKTLHPATTTFTSSASAVFRGCMFAIVRIAPPTWAVDFDSRLQEQLIKRNGGQMVSLKLLDALRIDAAKAHHTSGASSPTHLQNNNIHSHSQEKRTCYVVCWGGFSQTHLDLNPILSQLQRHNLCNLALVTPLWLSTCVDVQKRVPPHRLPKLFTPQPWLLRRISSNDNIDTADTQTSTGVVGPSEKHPLKQVSVQRDICVSVTGFSNTERAAIRQLLQAIGATYDSGMGNSCTHLMCREDPNSTTTTTAQQRGPKLERALQRGLPVVTMDWVYRVAQHGIDRASDTVAIVD